jgi:hypothetical protein
MEHWSTETDSVVPKHSKRNPYQCHFVDHKSHTNWHETEPLLPQSIPVESHLNHVSKTLDYVTLLKGFLNTSSDLIPAYIDGLFVGFSNRKDKMYTKINTL